jgi:hypothetical protein
MIRFQLYDNRFKEILDYLEDNKKVAEEFIEGEIKYLKNKYHYAYLPAYSFAFGITGATVFLMITNKQPLLGMMCISFLAWYVSYLTRQNLLHYFNTINARLMLEIKINSVITILEMAGKVSEYQNPNNPPPLGPQGKNNPFDRN